MAGHSRKTDPATSHAAAKHHIDSGHHANHSLTAIALVRKYPGYTFRHLYQRHQIDANRRGAALVFEDAPALMRRLSEVAHKFGRKKCPVSGRACYRWWPVEKRQ